MTVLEPRADGQPLCQWPKPNCPDIGTEQRQMLRFCPRHAAAVDEKRNPTPIVKPTGAAPVPTF